MRKEIKRKKPFRQANIIFMLIPRFLIKNFSRPGILRPERGAHLVAPLYKHTFNIPLINLWSDGEEGTRSCAGKRDGGARWLGGLAVSLLPVCIFLAYFERARDPRTKLNLERCESVRVCATNRPESRSRKVQFVREKNSSSGARGREQRPNMEAPPP